MTDAGNADSSPFEGYSKVWLVPLVAALLGCWLVFFQWSNQGPLITIEFDSAQGIEADKTKIKTRNVEVGIVQSIRLKPGSAAVLVEARIDKDAAPLLRDDTQFWTVSPRVGISGVSGLSTLLSGAYIEMSPGQSNQDANTFVGLPNPPITPAGTPGLHITLNSDDRFAYSEGDPLIYHGLTVGRIEDTYFNLEERVVYYNAFVEAPYHELLTDTTRFWDASGLQMDLKSDGISIKTGNFETLITNGIEFDIPEGYPSGDPIAERSYYDIYPNYEQAAAARFSREAKFVIMVADSVRGLNVGAPVEYRGIQVGRVIEVLPSGGQPQRILDDGYRIPVIISVQPGRVGQPDTDEGVAFVKEQTLLWVDKGFRATLQTGNLLTGAQYVELEFHDNHDDLKLSHQTALGYPEIPVASDDFTQFGERLNAAVDSINSMKLDQIGSNANMMLVELAETAKEFRGLSEQLETALSEQQLQQLVASFDASFNQLNQLMSDYSSGSEAYVQLNQSLRSLDATLRDLRPILHELDRKPNSLVFSSSGAKDPEPKAKGTN